MVPPPLVSVTVPTRNSKQWLERCLVFIARQTHRRSPAGMSAAGMSADDLP